MDSKTLYLLGADLLLLTHVLFVAFVVFGLVLILVGKPMKWGWVRNPWFRFAHLAAIGVVTLQAWLGVVCPLTTWEMALRRRAGDATYTGEFIAHWPDVIIATALLIMFLRSATRVLQSAWREARPTLSRT